MSAELGPKKLAAVMSVDIAGYSALAEVDEAAALDRVAEVREALEAAASNHSGRIFNTAGDGFMLDFPSAAGALAAAQEMCAAVACQGVRIGVHLCDVMVQPNGDLLGHGVNIAARLQEAATPGVVLVSVDVQRAVRGVLAKRLHAQGAVQLNKMEELIEVFVLSDAPAPAAPKKRAKKIDPVLAVLPFDNESDEAGMDHFSDGVADEIILTLMRYSELKVIGRTSAFQFRGDRKTSAAGALNATHVLDGAVRCAGPTLRVTAQLIDASTGVATWSARYDRALVDAFEVQDDIAAEVGSSLRRAFQRAHNVPAIDPAAYDLYLRARQIWLTLSDIEEEQAETLLMRCIALAPDFAPGWALLASVRAFLLPRDHDVIGSPRHAAAVEAAQNALDLDPDCAQAYVALALLKPAWGDYAEKIRLTDEALKRTPNDPALHVARASWLYSVGRLRDGLAALDFAARLDPLGPAVESFRGSLLSAMGQSEKAIAVANAAWMRFPDSAFAWYVMWATLCAAGRLDDAEALAEPGAIPRRAVTAADVAILKSYIALLRMNPAQRGKACAILLDTFAAAPTPLPLSSCLVAAGAGCAERAFDVIEQALDSNRALRPDPFSAFGMARAQSSLQLFVANSGAPAWAHPRFPALCAKLGLVQYWIESGQWPDCAAQTDYDFKKACTEAVVSLQG